MKRKVFRFLSLITACVMWISSVLFVTTASGEDTVSELLTDSTPTIVQEDTSRRGEYEKHFLMSDGSYQAMTYDEPVHRLVDGEWVEVDNSLQLSVDTDGVSRYSTVNGLMDVSFAQRLGNQLVTMKQDDYSISWDVQAVSNNASVMSADVAQLQPAQAQILTMDLSDFSTEEQKSMVVKSSSRIQYADALAQGVDLKYTVLPSRVKEDIILQYPQSLSAYLVTIYTEGLSARLLENREIEFYNSSDEVFFTMHAPYMYDSAGEFSQDIPVSLTAKGSGRYIMTMTPNASWLNDSSRVYPVVIDPNVSPSQAKSNIIDNYVSEGLCVRDNSEPKLYVGKKSGAISRAYIKYQALPCIPVPSRIDSAVMRLQITSGTSTTNSINAYTVTGYDWNSDTICWDNMPAAVPLLQQSVPATTDAQGNLVYLFSCTGAVRAWYTGSTIGKNQNYGIMVRYTDETIDDYNAFYSADYTTESSRPLLTIHYELPSLEPTIVWPVPGYNAEDDITSEWGYRIRNNVGKMHLGIDIGVDDVPVVAAFDGTVHKVFDDSRAGHAIVIQKSGSEFQARYYHLNEKKDQVEVGDVVQAGDTLGFSGNTGDTSGPHLHFQLQYTDNKYQSYNPIEIYHRHDRRSTWTNPNPMFLLIDGYYVPNEYFSYYYELSDYNSTDAETWQKP
ncbi:MAG: DNRLRE domain-containing protein [Oscillospiraceae bacterium]|nr:DNRLRE domain-containing protein [Oscillospiraceae bacterium]